VLVLAQISGAQPRSETRPAAKAVSGGTAQSEPPPAPSAAVQTAPDFQLEDYTGKRWRLHDLSDAKAVVLFVHGVGCPIVRLSVPALERLQEKYAPKGVRFFMINANPHDTAEDLRKDAEEFQISLPILMDRDQRVSRGLGAVRTCTAYLISPRDDWKIVYRGALSNRYDYGAQRQHNVSEWLEDALHAHLRGKPIKMAVTEVKGCLINYVDDPAETHGE
jgi:peroxiredoxin